VTLGLAVSFAVSTCTGVLLLWLVWPRTAAWSWPLATALGAGLGSGLSAVLLFLWMLAFGPTRGLPWAEGTLLILVALVAVRHRRSGQLNSSVTPDRGRASRQLRAVVIAFLVTLSAAAAAFVSHLRRHPHGEWDAWMNWDLRARMFFRGGEAWQTAFSDALPWSHPDYPVLLASLVTRTWLYAGGETLAGPALVAGTFTFATVALMVAGLTALRSPSQGLLAGLLLLSTPFFILHGTSLYADVPLSFFFLATVVCLALQERSGGGTDRFAVLAGVAAGLAMWTKNEGLLFTLALVAGLLIAGLRGSGWAIARRRLLAFGAGLVPMLLLAAGFKMGLAPPNDLLSTLDLERTFNRLTDPYRYYLVLRAYGGHVASFGSNGLGSVTAVLTAYLLGLGVNRGELGRYWVRAVTIGLVLLLAGHFMVFVSMADELPRLLKSSLDRLLLQIWPSALFLFFMVVRAHEEVRSGQLITGHPEVGQRVRV
jgi:hypothetical protein